MKPSKPPKISGIIGLKQILFGAMMAFLTGGIPLPAQSAGFDGSICSVTFTHNPQRFLDGLELVIQQRSDGLYDLHKCQRYADRRGSCIPILKSISLFELQTAQAKFEDSRQHQSDATLLAELIQGRNEACHKRYDWFWGYEDFQLEAIRSLIFALEGHFAENSPRSTADM